MKAPFFEAREVTKQFHLGSGLLGSQQTVHALGAVSFSVDRGKTLAIVGESGCGKSTLARCITGLTEPSAGALYLEGKEVREILRHDPGRFHRSVQIVFQDPYSSLNPRRTVVQSVGDGLRLHDLCRRGEIRAEVGRLLAEVGLSADYLDRYPHELSGGQRQRVAIARALAVRPKLIVCDEPVSALDVSIQAQVINLLRRIQDSLGVAYIFISHNLALVRHIADHIAVMYLGQFVEIGPTEELRRGFLHPYSRALFAAAPEIGRAAQDRAAVLSGDLPSPLRPPPGCRFHTRCPIARPVCAENPPVLQAIRDRQVSCHFAAG